MKKVAFFDVDGTLFRSSLLIEFVDALIEEKIFEEEIKARYEKEHKKWRERKGSYEDYISAVVGAFVQHIQGVHYGDFADTAKRVIKERRDYVYRYTRDLVTTLRKQKYYLVAISQSPKTIAEPFCKELGFHKVYGRIYEIGPSDRLTGTVVDEHLIGNKANIVRRVVENEGVTLEGSVGVGDTEGDIPLLEMVERPICFNPNCALYTHAKRLGWPVVVERKDVIYEL